MPGLIREVKYAVRSLLRDKAFTVTVVLTLAVCLGANTATFAIVNSVLLRPLPVPDAGAILLMSNRYPKAGVGETYFSAAGDYYDRLREVNAFEDQAMFRFSSQTIEINGAPERIMGMAATPSTFRLLRAGPEIGRTFSAEEGEIGHERKVILSYGLWQQIFGGDLAVTGRELRLSGRPHTIVGVMPRGFVFVNPEARLWIPLAFTAEQKTGYHSNNWYNIGRLRPGASLAQAQAQVDALNAANMERMPQWKTILMNAGFHTKLEPLQDMLVRSVEGTLYLLWGGAVFVLLIGGLNVANLALARTTLRRKELATRLALGAGRARLTRQIVVENVLVAVAGGVSGLALGAGILRALQAIGLERLPRAHEVRIDGTVAAVALAMAVAAGLVIGLAPMAHVFRVSLNSALHESGRTGSSGRGARGIRRALVVAQVGFAFVLLAGAGLLLASFRRLLVVDPGFRTTGVLTASTSAPRARYAGSAELRSLMNRALEALRRIPGVAAAGATTAIPFSGNYSDGVILAEGYVMRPGESLISPQQATVTPGYFEAMGISLLRGRFFEDRDNETSPPVVIVDERLARRFWGDADPIGRRMYTPNDINNVLKTDERTRWLRVVGVVRTIRLEDLRGSGSPVGIYYFPYTQSEASSFTFAIQTSADPGALATAVRAEMSRIDPELAMFDVRTMSERAELSLASRRTSMMLALGFGGLALFLSAVGIYGVLAYLVTQRRREIGIRVALGSTGAGIVRLVLWEGLLLAGFGIVLGLTGAALLRKAVESEIYGVRPLDPLVLSVVAALLGAVALAACVIPARRASRVDPVIVLSES